MCCSTALVPYSVTAGGSLTGKIDRLACALLSDRVYLLIQAYTSAICSGPILSKYKAEQLRVKPDKP